MQSHEWLIALRVYYTRGQRWWEDPIIAELYKSSISAVIQEVEVSQKDAAPSAASFPFTAVPLLYILDTPDVLSNIILYNCQPTIQDSVVWNLK